jgi:hypothetical protein
MPEVSKENKKLDIPEFKSDIPSHLLKECSAQEEYIMEQLSIHKQQNTFIIQKISDLHDNQSEIKQTISTNTDRIERLEEPKKMFSSKPMMIAVGIIAFTFLFVVYPYLLTLGFKELLPLLKDFFL